MRGAVTKRLRSRGRCRTSCHGNPLIARAWHSGFVGTTPTASGTIRSGSSAERVGRIVRSECVFCGVALTLATRATTRSPFTRSGRLPSNKSWCVACDSLDAPVRAAKALEAERRARRREAHRAYMTDYNQRPEVQMIKRQYNAAKRFRERASFRCGHCTGRFPGNRMAWRLGPDGRRLRLGLCAFCASHLTSGKPIAA